MFKGNVESGIVLVGEAPGKAEDKKGIPFVGDAGKILDGGLKLAHMTLNDCCVVNIMACRPCNSFDGPNSTPSQEEISNCLPRLEILLNIVKPSVVVLLGRTVWNIVTDHREVFSHLHIKSALLCSCLHPSALSFSDAERKVEWQKFWSHFRLLRKYRGTHRNDVVWKLPLKRGRG